MDCIEALLQTGADDTPLKRMLSDEAAENNNKNLNSELYEAASGELRIYVTFLLNCGAQGGPALMLAVKENNIKAATLLLDSGIKEYADDNGDTPLMVASAKGHIDCINALLKHETDKNAANKAGYTPLMIAAYTGKKDALNILLQNNANIEGKEPTKGFTALTVAVSENHHECVRSLIQAGANKEIKTLDGLTPLMIAASRGHPKCLHVLLQVGANKEANVDGATALVYAFAKNKMNCANALFAFIIYDSLCQDDTLTKLL